MTYQEPTYTTNWTSAWDLTTIPDDRFFAESGRRMSVRARRNGKLSNPKKLSPCPHCGAPKGVAEMRVHKPICRRFLMQTNATPEVHP